MHDQLMECATGLSRDGVKGKKCQWPASAGVIFPGLGEGIARFLAPGPWAPPQWGTCA